MALAAKYKFTVQGEEPKAKPKATAKKKSAKTEAPSEAEWCLKALAPTAQKWAVPLRKRRRGARRSNGTQAARSEGQGHRPA